jgi:hypothetical protein
MDCWRIFSSITRVDKMVGGSSINVSYHSSRILLGILLDGKNDPFSLAKEKRNQATLGH